MSRSSRVDNVPRVKSISRMAIAYRIISYDDDGVIAIFEPDDGVSEDIAQSIASIMRRNSWREILRYYTPLPRHRIRGLKYRRMA